MFVHGESNAGSEPINDNEATVFIGLGTDFVSNYYEYEMPVKISPGEIMLQVQFGLKKII